MAALYDLREELTALLRQGLPDAAVTGEYPGEGRRYPQTVPAVAVGIAEAALQKLDYLGEQDAGEQSGRRWETRFQLELSAPRRSGAGELYRLFDQVSGLLLTYGRPVRASGGGLRQGRVHPGTGLLCPDLHRPVRPRGDRDPARHCHHRL